MHRFQSNISYTLFKVFFFKLDKKKYTEGWLNFFNLWFGPLRKQLIYQPEKISSMPSSAFSFMLFCIQKPNEALCWKKKD